MLLLRCHQSMPKFELVSNTGKALALSDSSMGATDVWFLQERLIFTVDDQEVSFADREKSAPIGDFDHGKYRGYITHNGRHIGTLYWHLPRRMLGNKVRSGTVDVTGQSWNESL